MELKYHIWTHSKKEFSALSVKAFPFHYISHIWYLNFKKNIGTKCLLYRGGTNSSDIFFICNVWQTVWIFVMFRKFEVQF